MDEAASDIDREARRLHAQKCQFYGIVDKRLVDLYWEACDQAMYRRKAEALAGLDRQERPE